MRLKIIKIIDYKKSATEGVYLTVEMKDLETGKFYMTYLCPDYRNFKKWRKVAKVGKHIYLDNPLIKNENIIDADNIPILINNNPPKSIGEMSIQELCNRGFL